MLPPAIRRKIVDLKAEHPPLNLEEIANVCGVLFGRRPDGQTVKAVLEESAIPRKLVRRFEPYHEIRDDRERREAVVTLHGEGWSDKSIARYLRVDRSTVYRARRRFQEEGEEGLEDRPGGRPRGVHKVDLKAMNEVRKSYARVKHWRVYAEEDLAACEIAVWLGDGEMALEYGGQTLSRYDVSLSRGDKLETVTNPRLFATGRGTPQPKLFALDEVLGEGGWLKALRLEGYALRRRRTPQAL